MCGRTVTINNFNHCPTLEDFVLTQNDNVQRIARWGMHFPHFIINCREDTKSIRFKQLREGKRCVVDALGYYEWKTKDKSKQPYYIKSENNQVLKLAGLYDIDTLGDGKLSYVTMTCSPSESLAEIHDRMPVILDENGALEWLSPKPYSKVAHLVKPYEKLVFNPVSTFVNDVRNNGPECIAPINLKKNMQSKLEFSNGVLVTPEKKKRKVDLELGDIKSYDEVVKKEIINLSDEEEKPVSKKSKRITPRKTPTKKLPKNQQPITKFFSPS
jgi:putative SOS response-associated peptidase YedK